MEENKARLFFLMVAPAMVSILLFQSIYPELVIFFRFEHAECTVLEELSRASLNVNVTIYDYNFENSNAAVNPDKIKNNVSSNTTTNNLSNDIAVVPYTETQPDSDSDSDDQTRKRRRRNDITDVEEDGQSTNKKKKNEKKKNEKKKKKEKKKHKNANSTVTTHSINSNSDESDDKTKTATNNRTVIKFFSAPICDPFDCSRHQSFKQSAYLEMFEINLEYPCLYDPTGSYNWAVFYPVNYSILLFFLFFVSLLVTLLAFLVILYFQCSEKIEDYVYEIRNAKFCDKFCGCFRRLGGRGYSLVTNASYDLPPGESEAPPTYDGYDDDDFNDFIDSDADDENGSFVNDSNL